MQSATLERPTEWSLLSDYDLHLFNEGTHTRAYRQLGAHANETNSGPATFFATWAPDADAVSVVADFNGWDPSATPLRPRASSGIWECLVTGVGPGDKYKYSIRPRGRSERLEKADPYAFAAEVRPRSASMVWDITRYVWNDAAWLRERAGRQALDAPISFYEVHLGSWKRI